MTELALHPQYEYVEVEILEVSISERVKALDMAYEWKQRVKKILEENEPKQRIPGVSKIS